jgi:twitching motility protein PilT
MEIPSIFLNRLLKEAAKRNASSMHLSVGSQPALRVDGQLISLNEENIITTEIIDKIISTFLSEEEQRELKENKEIITVRDIAGGLRFRVDIFYQKNLPSASFNYISPEIKSLSETKVPSSLKDIMKLKAGLFIVSGSYGSGKTTTAASLIEEINKNYKKNIVTIEDPIEFLFIGKESIVSQRQIGRDVKSVTRAIEHCLEEDADIVYLGEIKKDFEEAVPKILELAAGNSLVVWEINANSSIRAIEKILNAAIKHLSPEAARYSLADILLGIIDQRLIPKVGGGLVLAVEFMLASGPVKSLIREGKIYQLESIIQTSKKEGMISMSKTLEDLIKAGEIKPENADGLKLGE